MHFTCEFLENIQPCQTTSGEKKVRGIPLIFKLCYETPRFKLWLFYTLVYLNIVKSSMKINYAIKIDHCSDGLDIWNYVCLERLQSHLIRSWLRLP